MCVEVADTIKVTLRSSELGSSHHDISYTVIGLNNNSVGPRCLAGPLPTLHPGVCRAVNRTLLT